MRCLHRSVSVLALAGFWSCDDGGPQIDVESAIPVRVDKVAQWPIAEYVTATGTARAQREGSLHCRQAGLYQLQENPRTGQPFAMGDEVLEDELIVRLDNPEIVTQAGMDSKKLAFTSAQREYEKQQALFDKGGITLRELPEAARLLRFVDGRRAPAAGDGERVSRGDETGHLRCKGPRRGDGRDCAIGLWRGSL